MPYVKSEAIIRINDVIISFEDYNFSWSYTTNDDNSLSFLELSIPNLAKKFVNKISKNDPVIFSYGYDGKIGTLIKGTINKKKIVRNDAITEVLQLKVIEVAPNAFLEISKSYGIGTKCSDIIKDLARDSDLVIDNLELVKDLVHRSGYVAFDNVSNILRRLVSACGSKIRIQDNIINIYDENSQIKTNAIVINYDTGLLKDPESIEESDKGYNYIVTTLANVNIRKNTVLKLETTDINTYVKVVKFTVRDFKGEYITKILEV